MGRNYGIRRISKNTYTMSDFEEIIHTLRSENGCPWDREQTHMSLRSCMMEESAELLAAIRIHAEIGDYDNLKEELGDILLQVVMHSTIAGEEQLFNFQDVIQEISKKMIRRHPHVFGEVEVENSTEVLANWEEIKKEEKKNLTFQQTPLREIPIELPALAKAQKVLKKIDKLYEKRPSQEEIKQGILELMSTENPLLIKESEEASQTLKKLLLLAADYARVHHLAAEQLLDDAVEELIQIYEK